jgi:hypothetical protein
MILDSALASVCWWSYYHSSQLIVSIKSALTNCTIGSISHCCASIHTFSIHNAKKYCLLWRHLIFVFFSNRHCAFPLDNCNDSHAGIGIVLLYQHSNHSHEERHFIQSKFHHQSFIKVATNRRQSTICTTFLFVELDELDI